jgi:hypothetical protein
MANHKRRLPDHYFSTNVHPADIPVLAIGGCVGNGYTPNSNIQTRHKYLLQAIEKNGFPNVYRELYLFKNNDIVAEDINYMKKIHQKGGIKESMTDYQFKQVDLPEKVEQVIKKETYCANGTCKDKNSVYELHQFNDKQIIFYTLGISDVEQVHELDLAYLDSDQTLESAKEKIEKNKGKLIGIKANDKLQGYCQYAPSENSIVKMVWFCANKSYGTPLYQFMEKYFKVNEYEHIILVCSLEGSYAIRRLNFWTKMGFRVDKIDNTKHKLYMQKDIKI